MSMRCLELSSQQTPNLSRSACFARAAAALLVVLLAGTGCAQNLSFGDRDARHVPEWLHRASLYEVWLNAFSPEGNLRGAIPGLQHIADLGATIVYLGPIAKRSAEPHASPYSIADYNAVDPEAGTEQDLRDFVDAAHKLHLRVMLDIVYYHTAPDNIMMKDDPAFFQKTPDGQIARGFWPQPLPDFTNPQVRRYLIDSLVRWVRDDHVDGFRCDVGGGVPVSFWEEARKALDAVNPEIVLLSESDRPDDQLAAFDINYNFQYYLALCSVIRDGAPAIKIRDAWEQMHATLPRGARVLHYSDNHDWPRAVVQFGERGAMAASVLNFTLDGIPFVYNGQEVNDAAATHWRGPAPIRWKDKGNGADEKTIEQTQAAYKKLFALRAGEPALTTGEVVWINNTQPDSVLSFLRKADKDEVLVILNLSNRQVHVTIDLPVMDYYAVQNLLAPDKTWFSLYSGRVSADLDAFGYVVGKKIPLASLAQCGHSP
ncbi:MAG TPA: alpha-amylase family glycosyl hydrolase [Acidobacteriaceae bacterium]|jgi:glycosidase|nr:alpha-amylase family glycosyl hydrolase [Acidobacteriaceae bacterium]